MGYWILMKFDIWKNLVSQSSYNKSRPDPVTLGELEGETENLGKRLEWRDQDETWWDKRYNTQQEETTGTLYLQIHPL